MNQSLTISGRGELPLSIELLGDDELAAIMGGVGPVVIGCAVIAGMGAAAVGGVVVGLAFYYFSRDE